jgi:thiamine pyrophosphokinase
VKTEGLKWNLNLTQELSFTKLVSSSNTYENERTSYVDVYPDNNIIWTMTYICDREKK